MLSSNEEKGIRDILSDLTELDLFSLANTVTKGLLSKENKNDAVESIIKCLEKPSDLLKRQRITKRVLFSYLLKFKPVSAECSKTELVMMCLEEWKSAVNRLHDYDSNPQTEIQPSADHWLAVMGRQFSEWFFNHYNSLQDFGPEHFWSDCKLKGDLKIASDQLTAEVIGASDVVAFLSSLILNDKFFFHANNSPDSIVCEQDPHGLVKVIVSGVVHQVNNCIGLFDSGFGLIRNPSYDDNWKIKWIQLQINVTSGRQASIMPVNEYGNSICQSA